MQPYVTLPGSIAADILFCLNCLRAFYQDQNKPDKESQSPTIFAELEKLDKLRNKIEDNIGFAIQDQTDEAWKNHLTPDLMAMLVQKLSKAISLLGGKGAYLSLEGDSATLHLDHEGHKCEILKILEEE